MCQCKKPEKRIVRVEKHCTHDRFVYSDGSSKAVPTPCRRTV